MKKIKIIYVNGDYAYTRMSGRDKGIIEHFNLINYINDDINTQVKEIEIEADTVGFPGCSSRTIVYPFNYNELYKCYRYE